MDSASASWNNLSGAFAPSSAFPPAPGGGASAAAAAPAAPDRADNPNLPSRMDFAKAPAGKEGFIAALMPAAIEASKRTGVDPRIIVAQAAQETGWGKSAPGNNYFGIKSHGKEGGQTFGTHEVINGKRVAMRDSFRQFASPGDSVNGYADFLLENPRYKPMMQAQGLDAQLQALGASGYATDPNYAQSVGAIARGLPMPAVAANEAQATGQPVQVASNDPSAGIAQALNRPPAEYAGTTQAQWDAMNRPGEELAATGGQPSVVPGDRPGGPAATTDAGQRVIAQMLSKQPIGGAPQPMQQITQALGGGQPVPAQPVSDPQQQVAQAQDPNLPVMAGGSSGAITRDAQGGPDLQMLMGAAGNEWMNPTQQRIIQSLLGQRLDAQDPANQMGLEKARLELDALKNPKPKYDFMAGKDGSIFRANETDGTVNQVYGGKPDTFRTLTTDEKTKMGLPPEGAYQIGADNKISQIGGGGTTVNIDQKTEGAFEKKLAEKQAETFDAMSTEGMNAKAELGVIGELDSLLQGQGGTLTGLAGVAAKYGIGGEGMGDLQATQAIINKLIPTQRQPGSGSMSDRDVEMFTRSLPSLWNQPGGNQKILHVMRGLATYKQAQGEIADQILTGEISRQEGRKMLRELPNPLADFAKTEAAPKPGNKPISEMTDEELEAIVNGQ
ncbi:glucosaminidase domain-containing protein [Mesorhizobium sp.]|uniref:glycoside hydrolase family 73 protein n=1 Tax=Mesorhizobium sp. TaxID=1871066 RepID=UPI0025796E94|nr:glucosaminidase domain-containing protein [Mesorhizobium sp.]